MAMVSDFSSPQYWAKRFATERSFEWLANSASLEGLILEVITEVVKARSSPVSRPIREHDADGSANPGGGSGTGGLNILHFGCGTSTLGADVDVLLRSKGIDARVTDADYVAHALNGVVHRRTPSDPITSASSRVRVPLINLDVLDPVRLAQAAPVGGWDILIDKSTADAISCGPSLRRPWQRPKRAAALQGEGSDNCTEAQSAPTETVEPIFVLCDNLAAVTRPGGRWICISYSSTRFDHLKRSYPGSDSSSRLASAAADQNGVTSDDDTPSWRLVKSIPIENACQQSTSLPSLSSPGQASDHNQPITDHVVYTPETSTWAYILERQ